MQKHGTRFTGEPPLFHTNVNFQLLQTLSKCGLQHLKPQNVQLYLIQCHPPTKPCNTSLPCTSPTSHHLPTSIYHASRVPRRFQTPTAAFHCCTLAAPKVSTPFKQHFDEHMVNELRLCSIYVEYSIVVIIHHDFYHNSYISIYILKISLKCPTKLKRYHKISIVFFRWSSGPSSAKPSSTDLPLDSLNCRPVGPTARRNCCRCDFSMA